MINWSNVIDMLDVGIPVTSDPTRWNLSNPEYQKIYSQWHQVNFNMSAVKWINFYPGQQFDQTVVDEVAQSLKITTHRAWISKIEPGYFAPWHWDIDDNIDQYKSMGEIQRYSIFISNPNPAHFFTTDDQVFSNTSQGTIYKWKDPNSWHGGANAGLTPKYMFHILGY